MADRGGRPEYARLGRRWLVGRIEIVRVLFSYHLSTRPGDGSFPLLALTSVGGELFRDTSATVSLVCQPFLKAKRRRSGAMWLALGGNRCAKLYGDERWLCRIELRWCGDEGHESYPRITA